MAVQIEQEAVTYQPLWWQELGIQQTRSGYGSKLVTRYKINFMNKIRRVYCICYSNCGSTYVIVKGQRVFVDFQPD